MPPSNINKCPHCTSINSLGQMHTTFFCYSFQNMPVYHCTFQKSVPKHNLYNYSTHPKYTTHQPHNYRLLKKKNHLHLAPRLRMSGAVTLFPFYAFTPFTRTVFYVHGSKHHKSILTPSDPTSDLVRHYDFPIPLRCRVTSDTFFFAFVRPLHCRSLFDTFFFAFVRPLRCRSLSDTFPHVVRTLANK